jgi:hypothetical protein
VIFVLVIFRELVARGAATPPLSGHISPQRTRNGGMVPVLQLADIIDLSIEIKGNNMFPQYFFDSIRVLIHF